MSTIDKPYKFSNHSEAFGFCRGVELGAADTKYPRPTVGQWPQKTGNLEWTVIISEPVDEELPRHPEPPPGSARCNRCNRLHLIGAECVCWNHPNRAAR